MENIDEVGWNEPRQPFAGLDPVTVQEAVESAGFECDGRVFALNSYENRVYQVGIEDTDPVIVKFYRPGRWSADQILEEHQFCFELADLEIPVVAPLRQQSGDSLFRHGDFLVAVYPRRGGHAPELDNLDNLYMLGRLLGRIHAVGKSKSYKCRPSLDQKTFGSHSADFLTGSFLTKEFVGRYRSAADALLGVMDNIGAATGDVQRLRVHGDCHVGNMLLRDETIYVVDFDDSRMAPAVQDIWMLLSGDRQRQFAQLSEVVEGYREFCEFDMKELRLVEVLRTLRMMYYAAWLARRWHDPAFPMAFPWFNTHSYWEQHIADLEGQLRTLQEPPLLI